MEWSKEARRLIAEIHDVLPPDATIDQRKAAIRAAFPSDWRGASWPYKAWLKARKEYLRKYENSAPAPLFEGWTRDPKTGRPVIQ
ncbi:hypothetical protein ACIGFJ_17170 [Brevundimonas diminuta]|uniref:hypothetical protein n=1 Tax=Brevundimonas diminuta TaxID=293 RepID=UPI0037C84050